MQVFKNAPQLGRGLRQSPNMPDYIMYPFWPQMATAQDPARGGEGHGW